MDSPNSYTRRYMKNFIVVLMGIFVAMQAFAYNTSYKDPASLKLLLNQGVPNGFATKLGDEFVDKAVHVLKAQYSFASQGGASVVLPSTLLGNAIDPSDGKDAVLPANAVVRQVTIDVLTAPVASTVAAYSLPYMEVGINSPADLVASTKADTLSGISSGVPDGTAAKMVKVNSTSAVQIGMSGGSVTAGKFNVFIEYYLSD